MQTQRKKYTKKKKSTAKKKKDKSLRSMLLRWQVLVPLCLIVTCLVAAIVVYQKECRVKYKGDKEVRLFIPYGVTESSLTDTLEAHLGNEYAAKVMKIWNWRDGVPSLAEGSYVVTPGMTAVELCNKLVTGLQDPVKVTFNNVRTMDQLAERVARKMEFSAEDFSEACATELPKLGFKEADFPAAFLPDTYEFYWSADPKAVVKRLATIRGNWWNNERRALADSIGLTPEQVATVASIVEEETIKDDERPMVARLYLNRIHKGMKLQADPTVKFALGDFSLRRITNQHLTVESPYNTYRVQGLPPGPIRIPDRKTLEAVLYAPEHDYLYMCAKEDFSGYHNFAVTNAEHEANARRYHAELNRRKIR